MLRTSPDRPVDPLLQDILQWASRAAQSLGIDFFVGGALARDLMLWHVHGQNTGRATRDVDLGLHLTDWAAFSALKARLLAQGGFQPQEGIAHRLITARRAGTAPRLRPGLHSGFAPAEISMDTTAAFVQALADEGFEPPVTVTREAGGMLDEHTHPFEAKALILSGEIRIVAAASERTYRVGDVFHLQVHEPHSEFYGPAGVRYLVGRKPTSNPAPRSVR